MPRALPDALPELSADELGWLATLDDVESRLVFTEEKDGTTTYRVEHGPFDEQQLTSLPDKNWTLLVQDVEKHLPVFRNVLLEVSFASDWRIDDLMVSFAAPGGSVGPHRDNYDVFLCQADGVREWRIAAVDAKLKDIESGGLSLLEPFADDNRVKACGGDVLYLPPGIAHWGIAREAAMTYSIGMRAPTLAEFIAGVSRVLDIEIDNDRSEERFYEDPDLSTIEAKPGLISDCALERARNCFSSDIDDADFATVFGSVVTDVKAWLAPEEPASSEIDEILARPTANVSAHGMARLAYCTVADQNLVFVNGHARTVTADQLNRFRRLCTDRITIADDNGLFRWLLAHGAIDLETDEQSDAT